MIDTLLIDSNADCGWLLQTSSYLQDSLIHVTFSFIDTENTNGCDYDYVEIFDGKFTEPLSLG